MRGGVGGRGIRGGKGAIDETPPSGGVTFKRYRLEDPGSFTSASTRVHLAGLHSMETTAGTQVAVEENQSASLASGAAQTLYAIPEFFHDKGRIVRLLCKIASNPAANGLGRMAIYRNAARGNPYPGSRVADSGDLDFSTAGVKGGSVSVSVSAGELLWFVWICNAQFQTNTTSLLALKTGCMFPLLGSQLTDSFATGNDKSSFGVGWRHAHTWNGGALPDPFPSSSPTALLATSSTLSSYSQPAIYFGWDPA